jgi:hypothetical protein
MNGMRKVVFFLTAMMLAAFALPASADKVYQLTMSSSSLAAGVPGQSVTMQINNISSDAGNSNTSSFKLNAPAGFTIQQVYTVSRGQTKNTVAVGGGYTATVQVLNDGSAVWVSNIQVPLKPFGAALQLANMKVDVSCSPDRTGLWVLPGVWTGSGFSGQTFTLNTTQYPQYPSIRNTSVSGICANYTITPTTTAAVNAGGGSVSLSFNNTSPAGGASIASLSITAPTNFTITGGTANNGGTVTPSGSTVTVTGGSAVAPGSSVTLNLTVTTPNCNGANAALWSAAQVSTGATPNAATQFSGPTNGYPSTGITALPCSATFVDQPATTFVGSAISDTAYNNPNNNQPVRAPKPVSVNLVINGSAAADGTVVTLSVDTGGCGISSNTASTSGGVAKFNNLSGATAGTDCTLGASGGGVNSTVDSSSFDLVGPAGILACAGGNASSSPAIVPPLDPRSSTPPASDGQSGWALVRGKNTDGGCGPDIPYTFSCDANRNCQFNEDSLGQHPSIEYVILWPKILVGSDPTADKQPCVSWGVADPDPGPDAGVCGGDYVPGLGCNTDNVDGGDAVMPDIPAIPPFSNFTGSDHPQYQPTSVTGQKAKVCIAQHGFTAGTGVPPAQNAIGYLIYWTKVIDQSDTGIRLP